MVTQERKEEKTEWSAEHAYLIFKQWMNSLELKVPCMRKQESSPVLSLGVFQTIKQNTQHYQSKLQVNNHTTGEKSVCKGCDDSFVATIH